MHDDLIDGDVERRRPTVGGRFRIRARDYGADARQAAAVGDAAAVLAGDLLLFEASRLVATAAIDEGARAAMFEVLDEAMLVSAAGELADVEHAARADCPGTDALLSAAHDKTATYSFEAPLLAGAILAGAPDAARQPLAAAAADLGLAFQLVDDLIGTFGTRRQAGRAPGADLREAKRTPLIALARDTASWPQVSSALAVAHPAPSPCGAPSASWRPAAPARSRRPRDRPPAARPRARCLAGAAGRRSHTPRDRRRRDRGAHPVTALYDRCAQDAAASVIAAYSTSFALACRLLSPRVRSHVRSVYALVRVADEIVDGAAESAGVPATTQRLLLDAFETETLAAIDRGFSTDLVVHAFALAARECGIDGELVRPFFASMRTDLTRTQHDGASPMPTSTARRSSASCACRSS